MANEVLLVANGDLRLAANRKCWPAQKEVEDKLIAAGVREGFAPPTPPPASAAASCMASTASTQATLL